MSVVPVPLSNNCNVYIVKKFVMDNCLFLQNNNDLTNIANIKECMENLKESYYDLTSFREEIARELIEDDFLFVASSILQKINQEGYFQNDDIWSTAYYLIGVLCNFSDCSYDFAVSILDTEIPNLLMSNVFHKPYRKDLRSKNTYYLLEVSLGIINNIARHPGKATLFKRDDLKQAIVEFIRINDSDAIGITSVLLLAYMVNENELHLLKEGKSTIKILIDKIIAAKAERPAEVDGFLLWELINGLKHITVNDNMKKAVVRENGINVIIDILKNPTCDKDIEHSLGIIWNLCFDSDIRNILDSTYNVRDVIKCYSNHKNSKIKNAHDGIFWQLDQKEASVERVKLAETNINKPKSETEWKFDVFLSYSSNNKQDVLMICNELSKNNLKVWIDVDQMEDSEVDAMSNGIENSKLFIMGVSEAYATNPNCRIEAEYAFSLKKPIIPLMFQCKYKPSGWLNTLVGAKMYHEFNEQRYFDETIRNLIRNIKTIDNNL